MRESRFREVKQLASDHTAGEWQGWESNRIFLPLQLTPLHSTVELVTQYETPSVPQRFPRLSGKHARRSNSCAQGQSPKEWGQSKRHGSDLTSWEKWPIFRMVRPPRQQRIIIMINIYLCYSLTYEIRYSSYHHFKEEATEAQRG